MDYFGGVFFWSVFVIIRLSLFFKFGEQKYALKIAMKFHDYISVPFFVCYVFLYGLFMRFLLMIGVKCIMDDYLTRHAINTLLSTYTGAFVIGAFAIYVDS